MAVRESAHAGNAEMVHSLPECDRLPARPGEITFETFIPANSRVEALRTLVKDRPSRIPICIQVAKSGLIARDGKKRVYKVGYALPFKGSRWNP